MATLVDDQTNISADVDLLAPEGEVTEVPEKVEREETAPLDEAEPEQEINDEVEETEVEEAPKKDLLPHERPSITQIKEKFPEFFKTFPALKDVIFREKEYSTVFPTIDDAREASESAELFTSIRNDVTSGDGSVLLNSLKEVNSLPKFAENFLPQLNKIDSETHWKVISPVLEHAVRAFYREGKNRNSEDMINAADHMAVFLFGDSAYASGKKTTIREVPEKDETVKKERETWEKEKFQAFDGEVQTSIYSGLKSQVELGLPKDLTSFVREAITKKIIAEVDKNVASDNTHMSYTKRLWSKAKEAGFRSDFKEQISSAYLSRAKSLIPTIRRRLLAEALGTSSVDRKEAIAPVEEVQQRRREPGSSGRSVVPASRIPSAKAVDWKNTSDLDLLNDKVTLKK